jgi:hypothetical protein
LHAKQTRRNLVVRPQVRFIRLTRASAGTISSGKSLSSTESEGVDTALSASMLTKQS